jgi:Tfp pilus assembly pilus retraction ATPase PilT
MTIEVTEIPGSDFTLYIPADSPRGQELEKRFKDAKGRDKYSCSPPEVIECNGVKTNVRALACRAYGGQFFSVTIRCDEQDKWGGEGRYLDHVKGKLEKYAKGKGYEGPIKLKDFLGYWPVGYEEYSETIIEAPPKPEDGKGTDPPPRPEIFLNDIHTLCGALYEKLFGEAEMASHPGGLVVITGATNSSKSLITRGLIFLLLENAAKWAYKNEARKPHLVTFEDPIEKFYVRKPPGATTATGQPDTGQLTYDDLRSLLEALYLDYTPRERGPDADSLKHVIEDALRQTPTALFVGETRERNDWKELLQFANTGHLVITTSHAKSVVEAMSDIFRDTGTKTQAQRSEIARRILGVVNVRRFTPKGSRLRALLPALWKSTPKSTANLVADGLASILPAQGREAEIGYYGRKYFAKLLTEESRLTEEVKEMIKTDRAAWEEKRAEIMKTANEWDFEGV